MKCRVDKNGQVKAVIFQTLISLPLASFADHSQCMTKVMRGILHAACVDAGNRQNIDARQAIVIASEHFAQLAFQPIALNCIAIFSGHRQPQARKCCMIGSIDKANAAVADPSPASHPGKISFGAQMKLFGKAMVQIRHLT